jgi:hypothetical protein
MRDSRLGRGLFVWLSTALYTDERKTRLCELKFMPMRGAKSVSRAFLVVAAVRVQKFTVILGKCIDFCKL